MRLIPLVGQAQQILHGSGIKTAFEPDWFPGSSVPESLTTSTPEDTMGTTVHPQMMRNQTTLGAMYVMTVMRMRRKGEGWVNRLKFCTCTIIMNVHSATYVFLNHNLELSNFLSQSMFLHK